MWGEIITIIITIILIIIIVTVHDDHNDDFFYVDMIIFLCYCHLDFCKGCKIEGDRDAAFSAAVDAIVQMFSPQNAQTSQALRSQQSMTEIQGDGEDEVVDDDDDNEAEEEEEVAVRLVAIQQEMSEVGAALTAIQAECVQGEQEIKEVEAAKAEEDNVRNFSAKAIESIELNLKTLAQILRNEESAQTVETIETVEVVSR